MKCPHCSARVSLFAKSMNKAGRAKACPSCKQPVRASVSVRTAALLFIPAVICALALGAMFKQLGLPSALGTAVAVGGLIALSYKLQKI